MALKTPDLIVTSALLPPKDDEQLMAHLRSDERMRDLRVLTVPPLIAEAGSDARRRWTFGIMKRPQSVCPSYDLNAVCDRINETLAQLRADRRQRIERERDLAAAVIVGPRMSIDLRRAAPVTQGNVGSVVRNSRRNRAHRWTPDALNWHRLVQSSSGVDLKLLNISTTGLLVESGARMMPDSFTELRLCGTETDILVPVRFVRSEVAEVNGRGVKYHSAGHFGRKLPLVPDRTTPRAPSLATPKALADLLARALSALDMTGRQASIQTLEEGLRALLSAREVRIRRKAEPARDGSDSIYLTIPTGERSPAVLQVTFERNYEPAEEEFRLLKAAAAAAAVILQFEYPRRALPAASNG